jgi:AcrR family transcriptional regulator
MARPKYRDGDTQAKERLEDAFWRLLLDKPYPKISVQNVADHAGLNKNTFYYHFENLDALAGESIDATLAPELPLALISRSETIAEALNRVVSDKANQRQLERTTILFSSNCVALREMIIRRIVYIWCEALNKNLDALPENELTALFFSAGGLTAVLNDRKLEEYPSILQNVDALAVLQSSAGADTPQKPTAGPKKSTKVKQARKPKASTRTRLEPESSQEDAFQQLSIL